MKEFIEKLIERLEEKKNLFEYKCVDYAEGLADAYEQSINIVNQLAEEYSANTPQNSAVNPTTNADRIKSMTDEELAELFAKLAWNSEVQTTPLKYLDWLQSEAE